MTDPITISEESWESLNQLLWLAHQEIAMRDERIKQLEHEIDVIAIENGQVRRREQKIRNRIISWAEEFMSIDARSI